MEKSKSKSDNELVARRWQAKAMKAHENVLFFLEEWENAEDSVDKENLLKHALVEMEYRKDRSTLARLSLLKSIAA